MARLLELNPMITVADDLLSPWTTVVRKRKCYDVELPDAWSKFLAGAPWRTEKPRWGWALDFRVGFAAVAQRGLPVEGHNPN